MKQEEGVSLSATTIQPVNNAAIAKSQPKNIGVLDGLRGIAILLVIFYHIHQSAPPIDELKYPWLGAITITTNTGVTLFFILSGFLLFQPYAKALLTNGPWPSLRRFYLRRVLRIIPAYYCALFIISILFSPQFLQPDHWGSFVLFLTFLMDTTKETFRQLDGPFWTLAIEWQFYMLLPFIALGFSFVIKRLPHCNTEGRRLLAILSGCTIVLIWALVLRWFGSLNLVTSSFDSFPQAVFALLHGYDGKYFEVFSQGMALSACFCFATQSQAGARLNRWFKRLSPFMLVTGLLVLYICALWIFNLFYYKQHEFPFMDGLNPYFVVYNGTFIGIGYTLCMCALLFGPRFLQRIVEFAPLKKVALISFGLYMWHLPFIQFFRDHIYPTLQPMGRWHLYISYWVVVALVAVPIATMSYLFIEKPAMQLAHRKTSSARAKIVPAPTREAQPLFQAAFEQDITNAITQKQSTYADMDKA
jgi:Predicted acyltransferases